MNRQQQTDSQQILSALIDGNEDRARRLMAGLPNEVREKLLVASYGLAHLSRQHLPFEVVERIEQQFEPKPEPEQAEAAVSGGE